jgi:hypothetical protein
VRRVCYIVRDGVLITAGGMLITVGDVLKTAGGELCTAGDRGGRPYWFYVSYTIDRSQTPVGATASVARLHHKRSSQYNAPAAPLNS